MQPYGIDSEPRNLELAWIPDRVLPSSCTPYGYLETRPALSLGPGRVAPSTGPGLSAVSVSR